MSYNILPAKEFSKDFRQLDASVKTRVKNKMTIRGCDPL